MTDIQ